MAARRHRRCSVGGAAVAAVLVAVVVAGRVSIAVVDAASSCAIDGVERVVAIGDVHGAFDPFVAILKTAGIVDEKLAWSGGRTHLVQVGDIVDRGSDSRKVLDLLQRLEREAQSAGGQVHALLGNHEVARMLGDLRYVTPGEYQAFTTAGSEDVRRRFVERQPESEREQLLKSTPLGWVELQLAFLDDGPYGSWLRSHDTVAIINGVLFVHGGISPAVSMLSCDDINATVHRQLTTDMAQTRAAPLESLAAREDGPLWYRGLAEQPETFGPEVDAILQKQKVRAMVIGHTISRTGRIAARFGGKVVQLDTGMQPEYAKGGRPSALEIRGDQWTAIYQDRRDVITPARAAMALPGARP